ncbi:MAG: nucleotidyltransferase family protein [Acidobacteriaceae bacterium]
MPSKPRTDSTSVPAIVLAGGGSTRLGQPKQLLRLPALGGETLIDHAINLAIAAGVAPVFVVLGADANEIQRQSQLRECIVVRNEAWREGMASSIRLGVAAVMGNAPDASGAMVLVCDQPALSADHLRALLNAHRANPKNIAASRYAGRTGVPVVFPRALFPALLELNGDQGARAMLQQSGLAVHAIDFPGGELDIDTAEDLQRQESDPLARPRG